jgi:large conductance mechanosensitive channel
MTPLEKLSTLKPTKRAVSFAEEFKAFAFRGKVIDMAVGVIIGAAFGKIIDSLVKNIVMPLVSVLIPSNQGYLNWKLVVGAKEIPYGLFIGEMVNFLIIAFAVFVFMVKFLGWLSARQNALFSEAEATEQPEELTKDQELLIEIRDLLRKNAGKEEGKGNKDFAGEVSP